MSSTSSTGGTGGTGGTGETGLTGVTGTDTTTSGSNIDSNTTPVNSHSGTSPSTSSTPPSHSANTNSLSSSTSPSTDTSSSNAPGTVDTTAGDTTSQGTTGSGTGGTTSDTTGHSGNAGGTPQVAFSSSSSSSIPLPTSTSTSSSSHLPTSTSSSSTSASTTISSSSSSSSSLPTSTSSSSVPAPTSAPTSSSTSSHLVSTSTDHLGSIVIVTQTLAPTPSGLPGVPTKTGGANTDTGPNIGAIIGGIAGGLVGVILLTYLILIPIRKRAALKKEVDWMAFGSENDHHINDSGNDSIYRTPRAGVGEVETKAAIDSPELYQMSDIGAGGHQGTLYSHLDANGSATLSPAWAATSGATGGYNVASQVVGDMPPGQYDQTYGAYYHQAMPAQQQQQQYGNHPSYSDHGSPETAAQRYVGQQQHPWPTTTTKSISSQHQHSPVNNYPFAPPVPITGGAAAAGIQRNYSTNERGQLSQDNHSVSGSTVTAYEGNNLMRTTSNHTGLASRAPLPNLQAPLPPSPPLPKMDNSDDCALAYVLDETNDSPTPDKGAIPGLHLANPDR